MTTSDVRSVVTFQCRKYSTDCTSSLLYIYNLVYYCTIVAFAVSLRFSLSITFRLTGLPGCDRKGVERAVDRA